MNDDDSADALALPHPNLGPEAPPLDGLSTWWLAVAGAVVVFVLAIVMVWRSRRASVASRRRGEVGVVGPEAARSVEVVVLAASLREALAVRFGESWRARTTEEIAATSELADAIGAEDARRLVDLFRDADLAKFAGRGGPQGPDGARWGPVAELLRAAIAAGARSTTTGK